MGSFGPITWAGLEPRWLCRCLRFFDSCPVCSTLSRAPQAHTERREPRMDTKELLKTLRVQQRAIEKAIEVVSASKKAGIHGPVDALEAKKRVRKLRQVVATSPCPQCFSDLQCWMEEVERDGDAVVKEAKASFGAELESELQRRNRSMTGHYPTYRCGFFTVEANVEKASVRLWYGPQEEQMGDFPMAPSAVADGIENAERSIGSGRPEEDILTRIQEACSLTPEFADGRPVPIVKLLSRMAHVLQERKYHENPTKDNYTGYSRADFSYDLYRLQSWLTKSQQAVRVRLEVASRERTRDRSMFLWVPDDSEGRGARYSSFRLERPR